jgi:cation:H+ antiporter
MDWVLLVAALGVILGGAELFTNGVEWVGEGFGLSEGAVGSVLAAIGTALPETLLPLIAILFGAKSGKEVGVGAILGAPFMLSTLAMFVLGATIIGYSATGRRTRKIRADHRVPKLDLAVFLGMFTLAILAGLIHLRAVRYGLAVVLVVGYGFYVRRHFTGPEADGVEREAADGLKPMYLGRLATARSEATWLAVLQALAGLAVIAAGARVFVDAVTSIADQLHVSQLAFALLVAPVATELPETFNAGVIWARRGKDTLAVGNLTGAMVFQAVVPVSIGLTLTPWRLTSDSLVAALVALGAAAFLFGTLLLRNRLSAPLLLFQGVLYVGYVAYVLSRL